MSTVNLTPEQQKTIARSWDRYQKSAEKFGDELSKKVAEATSEYVAKRRESLADYQTTIIEIGEAAGIDPRTVQRFDVDRLKGTVSFTVVQGATPPPVEKAEATVTDISEARK